MDLGFKNEGPVLQKGLHLIFSVLSDGSIIKVRLDKAGITNVGSTFFILFFILASNDPINRICLSFSRCVLCVGTPWKFTALQVIIKEVKY